MNTAENNQDNAVSPPLTLNLFGPFEVRVQGVPLARLHSRKGLWLLALLTLRKGKPVERDWLVSTLWPDSGQSQGLAYLRQSLTELRRALASEAERLQTPTRATLALDLTGIEVDALIFDACLQQAEPAALKRAIAVYQGPLLADCAEEWVIQERADREQACLMALQNLAENALAQGETEAAIHYARRVIGVDPLQEGAQRLLLQALAAAGDFGAVTQVYRDLRLYLHRELKAEPDPKTTTLYNQLRAQNRQKAQMARETTLDSSHSPISYRLPRPLTEVLGREKEILKVAVRLRQRRLVTLTGTGGVGKTRLAIAVAEAMRDEYADGVCFVELAGVSEAGLVLQSLAATLGLREESGCSLQAAIESFLRSRLLLIVLDNCEHLLQACAQMAKDLLQNCAGVRILATSRQTLGVTGEVNWQVPSLPVPDLENLTTAAELLAEVSAYPSVQLFVERAEETLKTFDLTDQNAFSVAFICARLDGIPLALELAASNVRVLSIEQIARRLEDIFQLLTRGSRMALPRQQTLRATLDWSHDLLTGPERTLLRLLSVFAGGWTLETAEQVCAFVETELDSAPLKNESAINVLDTLTSLVDKSLVQIEEQEGGLRYRMLETVRQYARDRLVESGEGDICHRAHRDYFLQMAEEVQPKLRGSEQGQWLRVLDKEHDNLRQALTLCTAGAENTTTGEKGLRLGAALQVFWLTRGHLSEGRERLRMALAHPEGQQPTKPRTEALYGAGVLAYMQGDNVTACALLEESLAIARELEDKTSIAYIFSSLGNVAYEQEDHVQARVLYEESLRIRRELGDKGSIARSLNNLGNVAKAVGDNVTACALLEESLTIMRELGDKWSIAVSLINLGNVAENEGKHTQARDLYEECLVILRELGDKRFVAYNLEAFASLAVKEVQAQRAVRLWGAAAALRETVACSLTPIEIEKQERERKVVQQTLGEDAFAATWTQGQAMTMEQAIEYALG